MGWISRIFSIQNLSIFTIVLLLSTLVKSSSSTSINDDDSIPIVNSYIDVKCFNTDIIHIFVDIISNCYDSLSSSCMGSIRICANYDKIENFNCCDCLMGDMKQACNDLQS